MDAQPVRECGLHTDGTTHADLARALDGIRARGYRSTAAKSSPTTSRQKHDTPTNTSALHVGVGTASTRTAATVVLDQVQTQRNIQEEELEQQTRTTATKTTLRLASHFDYCVITMNGCRGHP